MAQSNSTVSLRFRKLADNLCTLNKISSKIPDNAKFEYDSFQSVAIKKHREVSLTYDPRKERLGVFLGKEFGLSLIIFGIFAKKFSIFRMTKTFVERGFSVNMLTIDDNMQEKSSIALQRLIYDSLKQEESS